MLFSQGPLKFLNSISWLAGVRNQVLEQGFYLQFYKTIHGYEFNPNLKKLEPM